MRDLSTADSPSQHIQYNPQPPKRVPDKRVKTRGFICSQRDPFKKQRQVHLDQIQTPCWREAGKGHLHNYTHTYPNTKAHKANSTDIHTVSVIC